MKFKFGEEEEAISAKSGENWGLVRITVLVLKYILSVHVHYRAKVGDGSYLYWVTTFAIFLLFF